MTSLTASPEIVSSILLSKIVYTTMAPEQGDLLKSIDNNTVRRQGTIVTIMCRNDELSYLICRKQPNPCQSFCYSRSPNFYLSGSTESVNNQLKSSLRHMIVTMVPYRFCCQYPLMNYPSLVPLQCRQFCLEEYLIQFPVKPLNLSQ